MQFSNFKMNVCEGFVEYLNSNYQNWKEIAET